MSDDQNTTVASSPVSPSAAEVVSASASQGVVSPVESTKPATTIDQLDALLERHAEASEVAKETDQPSLDIQAGEVAQGAPIPDGEMSNESVVSQAELEQRATEQARIEQLTQELHPQSPQQLGPQTENLPESQPPRQDDEQQSDVIEQIETTKVSVPAQPAT